MFPFLIPFSSSGNTHEDIDGLFGVIRRYLRDKSWRTYDELVQLIRAAFRSLSVPVVVRFVYGTLDFDTWFKPCIDPKLSNFSRQHKLDASFNFLIPFSWGRAEPTVAELVQGCKATPPLTAEP